ncbi:hypothetical protein NMY22_g9038 [Coprinellus aureogranulatus]|nr:hypothetical protein NMY22_g9038 [Coprinellus aureogranulatus]
MMKVLNHPPSPLDAYESSSVYEIDCASTYRKAEGERGFGIHLPERASLPGSIILMIKLGRTSREARIAPIPCGAMQGKDGGKMTKYGELEENGDGVMMNKSEARIRETAAFNRTQVQTPNLNTLCFGTASCH